MHGESERNDGRGATLVAGVALLCFLAWTATSAARWAGFAYRTFDLAYYVQALWQLIHGRLEVSVQYVPLLGNHVEPIVLLIAPIFFLFPHPMTFVVLQNLGLASMGLVGYRIARRSGIGETASVLLALALLLIPATGYVALHEFHPEALTAPFLLLLWHARLRRRVGAYWCWFAAVLACKENMALLLAAFCVVEAWRERRRGGRELLRWYAWPMLGALGWFIFSSKVITPALNSGNIDYLALYDRLGASGGEILRNFILQPQLALGALGHSLAHGNLLWALLLPFLALPLLRPHWLLIALPVLLQHLLSWRSSEWTVFFHYAAPLLPLCWLATVEAVAGFRRGQRWLPPAILAACLIGQLWIGPAAGMLRTAQEWSGGRADRLRKEEFLRAIPAEASVVAPLPYLTHLALRERLHSLHYILKGLRTLSRERFQPPPPTDYVLLDYGDQATFDPGSGYFHPRMRTARGEAFPSSEELLHDFLVKAQWESVSQNELTLLRRVEKRAAPALENAVSVIEMGAGTKLLKIEKSSANFSSREALELTLTWQFGVEREVFPWMVLRLRPGNGGPPFILQRGLAAPEAGEGLYVEKWLVNPPADLAPGEFEGELLFMDRSRATWQPKTGAEIPLLAPPLPLGRMRITR